MLHSMKGGAKNRMPFSKELNNPKIGNAKDLQKYFEFYSIVGHGSIEPRETGTLFIVPERTYIMFTTRAGEPTQKIKPKVDEILNQFRYKKKDTSKASGLEDNATWFERTYDSMENGTLFKDLLYDLSLEDNSERVSIYQPGDLIQDLTVSIYNTSPPWDPVGIWSLPMNPSTEEKLQKARANFNTIKEQYYSGEGKPLVENIRNYFNELMSQGTIAAIVNPQLKKQVDQLNKDLKDMFEILVYSHRISFDKMKTLYKDKIPQMLQYMLQDERHTVLKLHIIAFNKKIMELAEANMIAQNEFDTEPNNRLNTMMSTGKIGRDRQTSVYDIINDIPSGKLTNNYKGFYPIYRFFLFDICRSLQEKPYPVVKRLVRSLSNVMRIPNNTAIVSSALTSSAAAAAAAGAGAGAGESSVASVVAVEEYPKFRTLLKLTKSELGKLISGLKESSRNPTLLALLRGEKITYKQLEQLFGTIEEYEGAFEEFIKYHRFDKNDKAYVVFDGDPPAPTKHLNFQEVTIQNVEARTTIEGGKSLYYRVKAKGEEREWPIFNRFLWKSLADYAAAVEEREEISTQKLKINTAYKEAEAKAEAAKVFDDNISHFTNFGKFVNVFKMGDTVKIYNIPASAATGHLNGVQGIIIGNEVKKFPSGNELLRYKVSITTKGEHASEEHFIPHQNLLKVSDGGSHKKSRRSKKQRRQTRKRLSKH